MDRAAVLMGIYGDELTIRRVQLSLIDQSALTPEEMRTLPDRAVKRWTIPLGTSARPSLFPAPADQPERELTEIQRDWLREVSDPVATR